MIGKGLLGSLLVLAVAFGPNQATAMEMMIVCTAAGGIASTEEDDAITPEDDKDELEVTVWVPPGEARDTVMTGEPVMIVTLIDLGDPSGKSVSRTTKLPDTGVVTEIWSRKDLTGMFRAEATKFGVLLTLENQRSVVSSRTPAALCSQAVRTRSVARSCSPISASTSARSRRFF